MTIWDAILEKDGDDFKRLLEEDPQLANEIINDDDLESVATQLVGLNPGNLNFPKEIFEKLLRKAKPLHLVSILGRQPAIELLLAHKAIIGDVNDLGATALLLACRMGHLETICCLSQRNAQFKVTDSDGCFPMLAASASGKVSVVKHLIKVVKYSVNETDNNGLTSLHMAAGLGFREVMECLMTNGASQRKFYIKYTPEEYARIFKKTDAYHEIEAKVVEQAITEANDKCPEPVAHIIASYCTLFNLRLQPEEKTDNPEVVDNHDLNSLGCTN